MEELNINMEEVAKSSATPLLLPREKINPVIDNEQDFRTAVDKILNGIGPIAVDAERASGFTYSARAYLIQIFRRNGGLHLIDPVAIGQTPLWKELSEATKNEEWIIHASTQDLPCLREVGLEIYHLFDTELGGRIAGAPRVGLGALVESLLGYSLAKEHSAVNWSTRPLRQEWLVYAALDVDILVDLRDAVHELLLSQNKLQYAAQEFAAIIAAPAPTPRIDPWRRTSGMHKLRHRSELAIVRELWNARDKFASEIDISPGRVMKDDVITSIASNKPESFNDFTIAVTKYARPLFENNSATPNSPGIKIQRPLERWYRDYQRACAMDGSELPEYRKESSELPPIRVWKTKNLPAYARLTHAKVALASVSEEKNIPLENLLSPDFVRRLCWDVPVEISQTSISEVLKALGARPWQIELCAPVLIAPLQATEPLEPTEPIETSTDEAPLENEV
jgi:ribonuclease D